MLLPMKDGGIIDITDDNTCMSRGCETCGYGSCYISEVCFELTQCNIVMEAKQMYEYPLSQGDIMRIILPNVDEIKELREEEFKQWLESKVKENFDFDNIEITIH